MNVRKETVVIFSPGFASSESDSTCLPAQQALVRCLNRLYPDLTIRIIAFQYPYQTDPYSWYGNQVIPLNGQSRGKWKRLGTWFRALRVFYRLHKKKPVAYLLSFWLGECAFTAHFVSKLLRIPHISWVLGQDGKAGNRYARLLPLHKMNLAAISWSAAERMQELYGIRKIAVLPNAIDPAAWPQGNNAARKIDVVGVGSLTALKQYDVFITIISIIANHVPGLRVMICGKGPEQTRLEQMIRDKGLNSIIQLGGELPHDEIIKLLQQSRILLHTSSYEGLSGACLEALAAGAHVLSFTGEKNRITPHWHFAEDEQGMADVLTGLLQDPLLDHEPCIPFRMEDTAEALMRLFREEAAAKPV